MLGKSKKKKKIMGISITSLKIFVGALSLELEFLGLFLFLHCVPNSYKLNRVGKPVIELSTLIGFMKRTDLCECVRSLVILGRCLLSKET